MDKEMKKAFEKLNKKLDSKFDDVNNNIQTSLNRLIKGQKAISKEIKELKNLYLDLNKG